MNSNLSDEVLMAYADDELDPATRQQVQAAISQDPEIARRVASYRALRNSLRTGFEPILEEPVPERLIAAARARPPASSGPRVVPLHPRKVSVRSWPKWAALAASFALGALALQFGANLRKSQFITESNGQLLASGQLQQALTNQLTGAQKQSTAVQIGVSFLSRKSQFCRTFQLREATPLAGLACNESGRWTVQILALGDAQPATNPGYRPAGSALPAAVIQAVNDSIVGDPLDAKSEASARARQWQDTP
jgi:negative regulator of sigma E activity